MSKLEQVRESFLRDMRGEQRAMSPLSEHLNYLRKEGDIGAAAAETLTADVIEIFTSESGLRVLKLMEKSVLTCGVPNGAPDGALREVNAVRNFVLDIRSIVSND